MQLSTNLFCLLFEKLTFTMGASSQNKLQVKNRLLYVDCNYIVKKVKIDFDQKIIIS